MTNNLETMEASNNSQNGGNEMDAQDADVSGVEVSRTNLIVNYLPPTMDEDEIKSLFSRVGEVDNVKLVRDKSILVTDPLRQGAPKGQSLGYGFVNFRRAEDAEQAINVFNGLRLQNKTIKVSFARPSSEAIKGANLYISGLPKTVTQEDLEAIFASFGNIITSRILENPSKDVNAKNVGFIRYDKRDEANHAIQELNNTIPAGCTEPITVKFSNTPGSKAAAAAAAASVTAALPVAPGFVNPLITRKFSGGPVHNTINKGLARFSPMTGDPMIESMFPRAKPVGTAIIPGVPAGGWSIFIYNLAPETEENQIWELFGPFGAVQGVKVIKDPSTNQCKGYAFVTMTNYEEATMAIRTLNGHTLGGRILQVSFKTNKSK